MSDDVDFSKPGPKLLGGIDEDGNLRCPRCGSADLGLVDGGDPLCNGCNATVYPGETVSRSVLPSEVPPVVLYHAGCQDGFAAAWVAHGVLGDEATYVPVRHGGRVPYVPFGAKVYILDFSYPAEVLTEMLDDAIQVIVLDHHLSAERQLAGLEHPRLSITFDMTKSGAMLAWEHFHPGEPAPEIVRCVQDSDLWQWQLPDSRAFSAALKTIPFDFDQWDQLEIQLRAVIPWQSFIDRGRAIVQAQDAIIKGLCDKAFKTRILGHSVPCVNSPSYQSEIGDELCRRRPEAPFSAIWFAPDMTSRVWSLRSRNGFDVSEVARYFGGGGHAAAASFRAGIDQDIASPPLPLSKDVDPE